jgi:hypothetical protein
MACRTNNEGTFMSREPHNKPNPLPQAVEWTRPQDGGLPSYQWRWFDNVEGWSDDYLVGILFALIGDTPRAVGLQLVPRQISATLPGNSLGQMHSGVYAKRGRGLEDFGESLKHLVLTTNELQTVPLQALADAAWDAFCDEIVPLEDEFIANISKDQETKWERAAMKHDPRAVVTVAEVTRIYLEASGRNPRDAVAKKLCIGLRTVDRYIKKARSQGLLPPVHPNAVRNAQARAQKATTKKGHAHAKKGK